MADQNPLSSRGSILTDSLRTVPSSSPGANREDTPADVSQYYQMKRGTVQSFRYPRGLGELDEYPHWLKIQIHKRNNAQVEKVTRGTSGSFVSPEAAAGDRVDPSSGFTRATQGGLTAGVATGAAGASIGAAIVGGLSLSLATIATGGLALGAAAVGAAVVGATTGAVDDALGKGEFSTLSSVIGLGLQEPPQTNYRTTWESQDMGEFLATGGASPGNKLAEIARQKTTKVTGLNVEGASQTARGEIRNPYKQQLFRSVEYRNFTFNFTFLPDSTDEANEIIELIKLLRETMLPVRSNDAFYLVYPAEYTLTYMYKNQPNTKVSGIGTCVLTDVGVRYGGNDFVTFINSDGTPAEIGLSLTFKEIVPLTANAAKERNL